jgi:hypothetical protein
MGFVQSREGLGLPGEPYQDRTCRAKTGSWTIYLSRSGRTRSIRLRLRFGGDGGHQGQSSKVGAVERIPLRRVLVIVSLV